VKARGEPGHAGRGQVTLDGPHQRVPTRPVAAARLAQVAAVFTPSVSVLSGGVICVVGVSLLALALPQFRRYDARLHQARGTVSAG
jgi:hypothetical protein